MVSTEMRRASTPPYLIIEENKLMEPHSLDSHLTDQDVTLPSKKEPSGPHTQQPLQCEAAQNLDRSHEIVEWMCCQCGHFEYPCARYNCKRCFHDLCPYCPRRRLGDST